MRRRDRRYLFISMGTLTGLALSIERSFNRLGDAVSWCAPDVELCITNSEGKPDEWLCVCVCVCIILPPFQLSLFAFKFPCSCGSPNNRIIFFTRPVVMCPHMETSEVTILLLINFQVRIEVQLTS